MKVLTSNFFPRQQPEGQGVSDSGSTLARKGFIKAQRAIHARRSLPHRVPCVDVTNGWQRALETARRCTKAREGFYSRLHEITSSGALSLVASQPFYLRPSLHDPFLIPHAHAQPPHRTRPRDPLTHATKPARSVGPRRAPRPQPPPPARFPLPARPTRRGGRFPRQPRGRSAAAWARAPKEEARAQARARSCRRRGAARAPPSVVGGGAEEAAEPRGREGAGGRRGEPREREPRPAPLQSRANPQPRQQVCVPAAGRGRGFPCHAARVLWPGRGWGPVRVCRVRARQGWDLTTDLHPLWPG